MLDKKENEMITKVGQGTPAGNWLRSYWHAIAVSDRFDGRINIWRYDEPLEFDNRRGTVGDLGEKLGVFKGTPMKVRLLGEDLVLFRNQNGELGLVQQTCPHRSASLEYSRLRGDGIECAYHGWRFNTKGQCTFQPTEPEGSTFKNKIQINAYPVKEMGGLIWAYIGENEPPLLPKIDALFREDGIRVVECFGLWPANYFQILENSPDVIHTGILHGGGEVQNIGVGERSDIWSEIPSISWDYTKMGMKSIQQRKGYVRESYQILPTINWLPQPWPGGKIKWPRFSVNIRTPVDDSHVIWFSVVFVPAIDGRLPDIPRDFDLGLCDILNKHRVQDYKAMVSQGTVVDRSKEHLGYSDKGVIMFRDLVMKAIDDVKKGKDPIGVLRGKENDKIIDFVKSCTDELTCSREQWEEAAVEDAIMP